MPHDYTDLRLVVAVRSALLARSDDNVHEAAVVLNALHRASLRLLLLILLRHLGRLTANLTRTSERTVHFALFILVSTGGDEGCGACL